MKKIIIIFLIIFIFSSNKVQATISYSSNTGGLGNVIEANGTNNEFGDVKGEVIFYGTDTRDPVRPYREERAYILSWDPNRVVYQVPIRTPLTRSSSTITYHFKIVKPNNNIIDDKTYELKPFIKTNPQIPSTIAINPDQGLGVCHAVDADLYNRSEISWQYPPAGTVSWKAIQPDDKNENFFDWTVLDNMVKLAGDAGKKIWIQVGTTEGAIPDWAAYKDPNGDRTPHDNPNINVSVAGTRCASREVKASCNNPSQKHMACDASCSIDGKLHAKGTPIPWNTEYQRLLRNLIHKMAERYDGNEAVEAVLTMAGGCYGELSICEYDQTAVRQQWEYLGYTNQRFIDAAKQIMDIYLERSYTWPNQTTTHGFLKTPIAEQLGMGLYNTGSILISGTIAEYADEKYGFRVWLKQNGLDAITGDQGDYYWYFSPHVGNTRVAYERGKWDAVYGNCPLLDNNYKAALNDTSSFTCGSPDDLNLLRNGNCEGYMLFAKLAGTHLNLINPSLTKDANDNFTFTGEWKNLGNFPLVGQKRVGIRDDAVSYKLAFYFIDQQTGIVKGRVSIEPSIPTNYWFGYKTIGTATNPTNQGPNIFSTNNTFTARQIIPNGSYIVKLAIEDEDRNNLKFRLTESGGLTEDQEKRYTLGNFDVNTSRPCTQKTTDFTVNDFNTWKNEFLNPPSLLIADYNCSGKTNLSDFEILRNGLPH